MSTTFLRPDPNNHKQVKKVKEKFEAMYGINTGVRTTAQWKKLVESYGLETVCTTEKMTPKEVNDKINGNNI